MDPSIMKMLEEDEPDESQYSGADVDAITAELNRDIGGDPSVSQSSDLDTGVLAEGSNKSSDNLLGHWKTSRQEENINNQYQQEAQLHPDSQEQRSSEMELVQKEVDPERQQEKISCSVEQDNLLMQQNQSENNQNARQPSEENQVQISEQNIAPRPEQDNTLQLSETQQQHDLKLPSIDNQQTGLADKANNPIRRNKATPSISFAMLIPFLRPHLDKDKSMQLEAIFERLRKNEVSKENFLRVVRNIVGDHMLRMAAHKLQTQQQAYAARNSQANSLQQYQQQSQASSQQLTVPSSSVQQFPDTQYVRPSQIPASNVKVQTDTYFSTISTQEKSSQKSRETGLQVESQGLHGSQVSIKPERESSMSSVAQANKQQQQHLHMPPTSFPMLLGTANSNYNQHAYSGPPASSGPVSLKAQTQDSQMRQVPHLQDMVSTQAGTNQPINLMNMPKYDLQNSMNETRRLHGGPFTHLTGHLPLQHSSVSWPSSSNKEHKNSGLPPGTFPKQEPIDLTADHQQKPPQLPSSQKSGSFGVLHTDQGNSSSGSSKDEGTEKQAVRLAFPSSTSMVATNQMSGPGGSPNIQMHSHIPSATTPIASGANVRTPPKKLAVGQKKPLEGMGTPPLSNKKQKVSGALQDQSIEQLNDVAAVSGVNIREEEEQLLAAPKEESRASEATRRVVQEEEERLILQKGPLQKKVAEIMSKCGIKSTSSDVERCLSLCMEERMRGLISNLIRQSKQRVDLEKPRHKYFVTSDVRRQILMINRKAKEEWERKQAEEAEKQRKLNETEANTGADAEKDKDEGRMKALKANKEEDDKMRTTAANVAARAAVGGDDMLQKWQLMAEHARQKREGGLDGASSSSASQSAKDLSLRSSSTSGKSIRGESQEPENKVTSAATVSGGLRKFGRNQVGSPPTKIVRTISIKDVIAVLEREPQMSKSTLIYRLYDRMQSSGVAE